VQQFSGGCNNFQGRCNNLKGWCNNFQGRCNNFQGRCMQNDLRGDAHFPPKPGHHFIFLYRLRVHDPVHILNVLQLGDKTKNRAQCGFSMQSTILITQ
jgi:hypothetical protein